jgi:preprotein translocase subunit SecA
MLSVIDQKWREHLYEMDYLQEGINLRAMGQKDPLVEWQREGFDMFEAMMGAVQEDFVRYVFHLEVVKEEARRAPTRRLSYSAPEDPVQGSQALQRAAVAEAAAAGTATAVADDTGEEVVSLPVRVEKVPGRNEPCYCGSGKKFKFCHGR